MQLPERWTALAKSPAAAKLALIVVPLTFLAFVAFTRTTDTVDAYRVKAPAWDFDFIVAAGQVITGDKARLLYSRRVDRDQWLAEEGYRFPIAYPYPPLTALVTAPVSHVSRSLAFDIWKVAIAASTAGVVVIVASAFKTWTWRIALAAAIVAWQPMLLNLELGQTGAFVALATAAGFFVFIRNPEKGALVLSLLALKPTAALPAVLAVFPQRFGVWLRFAVPAALIVLLPFAWLGIQSFKDWMRILTGRGSRDLVLAHPYDHGLTGLFNFSQTEMYVVLALGLVSVLLVAQRVYDRLGLEASAAFAVACGLLLNPHSMMYEWAAAFVAVYLIRQARSLGWLGTEAGAGLLGITLFIAGQWSASNFLVYDTLFRPLTLWALAVAGWIALNSLWPIGVQALRREPAASS